MEEYKDILDYFAHEAFQIGKKAPDRPQYSLKELLQQPTAGEYIETAMAYYLVEQSNHDLLDGNSQVSAHEVVSKFEKLYNLGVFLFTITSVDPDNSQAIRIDLFVWNGTEYIIINESVKNYLLETEKLGEEDEIGSNNNGH